MKLPFIGIKNNSRRSIVAFGGLNRTQNFSEGEFSDCTGISHLEFPFITQKRKWEKKSQYGRPAAITYAGAEAAVFSDGFYYDSEKKGDISTGEKQLIAMGDYIIILPDKKFYNIKSGKLGEMEAEYIYEKLDVTFTENTLSVAETMYVTQYKTEKIQVKSDVTMLAYKGVSVSDNTITFTDDGERKHIYDFSVGEYFKSKCEANQYRMFIDVVFDEESNEYIVENELVSIVQMQSPLPEEIKSGDAVEISGCLAESENNGTFIVSEVKGHTITFEGNVFKSATENERISIKRSVPDFSCACAYENRLWGCSGNTIYASKLGDPFNFHVYRSLSTDSYSVQSNDADDFTACIAFGNSCLFFKANSAYKLFGTKPSNFQLTKTACSGILPQNKKSLTQYGGKVFYCGNNGVYIYGGGTQMLISTRLGNIKLTDAAGGSDGKHYFLAATDEKNIRRLYVYDCEKDLWCIEDETTAFDFLFVNGTMHMLCDDGLYTAVNVPDEAARWSVTLHPFNEKQFRKKNYSRIYVCAELWDNAWLQVEASFDNKPFFVAYTVYGSEKKYLRIPLKTGAYNEVTLRISGKGRCRIESLVREFGLS